MDANSRKEILDRIIEMTRRRIKQIEEEYKQRFHQDIEEAIEKGFRKTWKDVKPDSKDVED